MVVSGSAYLLLLIVDYSWHIARHSHRNVDSKGVASAASDFSTCIARPDHVLVSFDLFGLPHWRRDRSRPAAPGIFWKAWTSVHNRDLSGWDYSAHSSRRRFAAKPPTDYFCRGASRHT